MTLDDLDGDKVTPVDLDSSAAAEPTLTELEAGTLYQFASWDTDRKNRDVLPRVAAGVYTIWDGDQFIYSGMSGKDVMEDDIERQQTAAEIEQLKKGKKITRSFVGIGERLGQHAGGRLSGDQFNVYVCNRLIIPNLTREQQDAFADGRLTTDALTRAYIRERYTYRFVLTANGPEAMALERRIIAGALTCGRPLLNSERQPLAKKVLRGRS